MKFAYIVMFELRSLRKTFPDLKKFIIDHFDADVFIVCQKQFNDDNDEKLELFKDCNVIKKIIYDKPEPKEYYKNFCNVDLPYNIGNWNKASCMQIYINHSKLIKELRPYINNYDYFISLRVDISFLFPFPIKSFFSNINPGIYTFKSNYCSSYGGYGMGVFIHRNYIEKYLTCYEDGLNNEKFTKILIDNKGMNQENFLLMCMKEKNICFYDICHMNNYYTADSIDAYTTWSQPHFNSKYNIICKKDLQVDEVYKNYELWKNNYRWKFENNKIFLEKSEE